ncbi:MAG: hypothetical protein J4F35_18350 [Candidatus Latescibacteria bacterium]|nr:hypothetical protein [Candidatus Latescibacterota bacterium]
MRTTVCIALLLFSATVWAQPSVVGAWEGCRAEWGSSIEHLYVEFNSDGRFRRVALRDDPERPVADDRGRYEVADGVVTLRYTANVSGVMAEQSEEVSFQVVGDSLYWGAEPALALGRAQELGDELLGQWGIVNFADGMLAGGWDL